MSTFVLIWELWQCWKSAPWETNRNKLKNTSTLPTTLEKTFKRWKIATHTSTAQMQKDWAQTSKAKERKCSSTERDEDRYQTTAGEDFTRGGGAASPQQDTRTTWTTHNSFNLLPPPYVSSLELQLKWWGAQMFSPFSALCWAYKQCDIQK